VFVFVLKPLRYSQTLLDGCFGEECIPEGCIDVGRHREGGLGLEETKLVFEAVVKEGEGYEKEEKKRTR